jgi:hypothetical protein
VELGIGIRAQDAAIDSVFCPNISPAYHAYACAGVIYDLEAYSLSELTVDQVCIGSAIEER